MNLTCVGISPSEGKCTQFRHILVTMSSRITTISCVQYWMRHGLDVKTALGTLRRKSSVMELGMAGLEMGQKGKTILKIQCTEDTQLLNICYNFLSWRLVLPIIRCQFQ